MTPREQALARIEEELQFCDYNIDLAPVTGNGVSTIIKYRKSLLNNKAVLELHLVGISPTTGKEVCDFCSGYAEGHWHEIKSPCPTADLIIKGVLGE